MMVHGRLCLWTFVALECCHARLFRRNLLGEGLPDSVLTWPTLVGIIHSQLARLPDYPPLAIRATSTRAQWMRAVLSFENFDSIRRTLKWICRAVFRFHLWWFVCFQIALEIMDHLDIDRCKWCIGCGAKSIDKGQLPLAFGPKEVLACWLCTVCLPAYP